MPTSGGAPPHLPSLDNAGGGVNSSHHSSRNGSSNTNDGSTSSGGHSASLRGHSFNRVPDICNQPLHTLLPVVKEGWLPPEPYYITQNVVYVCCPLTIFTYMSSINCYLDPLCCKKSQKCQKKSPCQETSLGTRGHLKILNDTKLVLNEDE